MAFCPSCGKELQQGTRFCAACGAGVEAPGGPAGAPVMSAPTVTGLQKNIACMLCYVLGWVSGLVFFFVEKDRDIKFHAVQSVVVFGALHIVQLVLTRILWALSWRLWAFVGILNFIVGLGAFALWLFLVIKAYNNQKVKLPFAGDLAEKFASTNL